LAGICTALASTAARWTVFVPVDLPLLPASLVRFLLDRARLTGTAVTIASVTGIVQTFPSVLDRAVLPGLQSELAAGRGGCFSAFQVAAAGLRQPVNVIAAELLAQAGQVTHPDGLPAARWFFNVNSAGDLRRASSASVQGRLPDHGFIA
jgi:molybdopterin-guanine dinucleotide biosynthesis protein A